MTSFQTTLTNPINFSLIALFPPIVIPDKLPAFSFSYRLPRVIAAGAETEIPDLATPLPVGLTRGCKYLCVGPHEKDLGG
jgi:hypothetical protein